MASIGLPQGVGAWRRWSGNSYISGSGAGDPPGLATRGGAPASIKLALFLRDECRPVEIQWSQSNGHYQFSNLNPDMKFFVVGFDHLLFYQAGITDYLTPKV